MRQDVSEVEFSTGIMPVVQWLTKSKGYPTATSFETISAAEPMDAFATLIGPFGPVPGVQVGFLASSESHCRPSCRQ